MKSKQQICFDKWRDGLDWDYSTDLKVLPTKPQRAIRKQRNKLRTLNADYHK